MENKKKAFTLVELIVGLSMQIIIMAIGIRSVAISFKEYNYHKEMSIENDKVDEAILTINRYTKGDMIEEIYIDEVKNEIKIVIRDDHIKDLTKTKEIKIDKLKRLTLESYTKGFRTAVNIILRDTEKFDIIKKGEINYLIIKTIKGDERIICL